MQSVNPQLTEQDQQRFNRQLQDPNDEIGLRSDDEEDEEDDSNEDEFVSILRGKSFHSFLFISEDESEEDGGMDPRAIRGNKLGMLRCNVNEYFQF